VQARGELKEREGGIVICDNVLKYIKIDADGNVIKVYHKTASSKPVRVSTPDGRYFELEYDERIPVTGTKKGKQ